MLYNLLLTYLTVIQVCYDILLENFERNQFLPILLSSITNVQVLQLLSHHDEQGRKSIGLSNRPMPSIAPGLYSANEQTAWEHLNRATVLQLTNDFGKPIQNTTNAVLYDLANVTSCLIQEEFSQKEGIFDCMIHVCRLLN